MIENGDSQTQKHILVSDLPPQRNITSKIQKAKRILPSLHIHSALSPGASRGGQNATTCNNPAEPCW
jgi:hypothetical protein